MANPWKKLQGLLVGEPRQQVAAITADNNDGTYQVTMLGGGSVRVTGGDWIVGQNVFVKGSQILALAPSLNIQQIEV